MSNFGYDLSSQTMKALRQIWMPMVAVGFISNLLIHAFGPSGRAPESNVWIALLLGGGLVLWISGALLRWHKGRPHGAIPVGEIVRTAAASMDLSKLWALISADLARARNSLPDHAASDRAITEYQGYLNHNELELACDMLEAYAEDQTVTKEFWLALRDAAAKMKFPDRVRRYEKYAKDLQPDRGLQA
jgi:hypothetical protein